MNKVVEIDKVRIQLIEEGILEILFKEGEIEVKDVSEMRQANLSLTDGRPFAVLVIAQELVSFSQEVRELFASREFKGGAIATALVYEGLGQRIQASFYLRVNKPHIKTKIFSEVVKAIIWLREELRQCNVRME